MAGAEVSRASLDNKMANSLIQLRTALDSCVTINGWLVDNPVPEAPAIDPLIEILGYTEDEAYLIRVVFEQIAAIKTNSAALNDTARKLTGLE